MMETNEIELKPAVLFALIKTVPLTFAAVILLVIAWRFSPFFLIFSLLFTVFSFYRFFYIRATLYLVTSGYIRVSRGIFLKRTDQVELFRIKDYVIKRPFILQLFHLMDLTLKGTDPENPILWMRGIPESNLIDTLRVHILESRRTNGIYEIS